MRVKFSVVTINYNNKEGLSNTIQSVTSQKYSDVEYIVIDGGSDDGSISVIEEYREQIDCIVIEKDKGIYDAMNKGIERSTGDYLIFMNSGDTFFDSETISTYVDHVDDKSDILYGDAMGVKNGIEIMRLQQPKELDVSFWLFHSINHQASAISKNIFDRFGVYSDKRQVITVDWQYFIKIYLKDGVKFKYINQILCNYDLGGVSSDVALSQQHRLERESFIEKKLPEYWQTYQLLYDRKQKRTEQYFYIKQFPMAFKILKGLMSIILVFLPKRDI
ncbi:glycosyltransferase family 2 protein [Sphingobacterium paucimobilis]|uniref:Glycosyltransferase 2-like domain-containing protein n=1 Tax=Sphingobacterium paucimobilis HER1398 TaxID=1346330 RepID=U2HYL3_9SPHI|nr:glycosyltransferase family 2 protein [Sphingobacterium paucimobilis]ERJ60632.1 hypothetical protein M472_17895 [Sphingobacterium paucimobilis HER1398]